MRKELLKYVKRSPTLKLIYIDDKGNITKRTVRVLKINNATFTVYCYLRRSRRTFKVNNLLALVPVLERKVV